MTVIRKFPFTYKKSIDLKNVENPVYQNLIIPGVPDVLIYENGSLVTRKFSKIVSRFNYFDYVDKYYQDTFIKNYSIPFLICFCDGSFNNLDDVQYDPEIIKYLNKTGLHIYFWELVVYKTKNTKTTNWLIDEYDNIEHVFLDNKDTIIGFETTDDILESLEVFEFEKISKFVSRNKLTNVTVFTGNYNNKKYLQKKYLNLKIELKDIVVASMFNKSDKLTSYSYIKNKTTSIPNELKYKFISLNKRYAAHRNLVAAYLLNKSSIISYNADFTDFLKNCKVFDTTNSKFKFWLNVKSKMWFDLDNWKDKDFFLDLETNLNYLENKRYISVDKDIKEMWFNYEEDPLPASYYDAFCAVVTESEFAQPCGHYADKTLNAIKCFRPFVLAAPPHTLEYLKLSGVKTFSDYWDESYDQEENHEQRLLKIFKTIDYINSKSLTELREIYIDMIPLLTHNYQVIENLKY